MKTLHQDSLIKVKEGLTTLEAIEAGLVSGQVVVPRSDIEPENHGGVNDAQV
jgi:hypothetical protein